MRFKPAGGLDVASGALIVGGAAIVAGALVGMVVLLTPPGPTGTSAPTATATAAGTRRPSEALPPDRVAAVLSVEAALGAGAAARNGDRVDVLGYFSRQSNAPEGGVTRVLVEDVPVLGVDRSGSNVALTLAVPQQAAVLLQEAQALGVRPFVLLRPNPDDGSSLPRTFSDSDLATWLAGAR